MAEGWLRALADGHAEARSAGIEAHGQNPRAIAAMAEAGVDIGSQTSSVLDDADVGWADVVVTVCGHADEHCPVLPAGVRRIHWPLPDPARAEGTEAEISAEFRRVRDDIRERVTNLIADLNRGDSSA
jgi:arsenate reductase